MKNLQEFVASTIENGGATINPATGDMPTSGYVVSTKGNERTFPLFGNEVVKEIIISGAIKVYLEENIVEFVYAENFLGSWIDNGLLYLDISNVYNNEHDALRVAVANNQLAYYDLNNAKTIEL